MNTLLLIIITGVLFVVATVLAIIGWTRGSECKKPNCEETPDCPVCGSSINYSNVSQLVWEPISQEVTDELTNVYNKGQWSDNNIFAYRRGGTIHNGIFFLGRALGYERFVMNRSDSDILGPYTSSRYVASVLDICRAQGDCDPIAFEFENVFPDLWDAISSDVDDKDIVMLQLYTLQRFAEGYIRSSHL